MDHVVPLACGGADSPSNMQWQTAADAKQKDKVERRRTAAMHRVLDGVREVGVLLVAFTPLDYIMQGGTASRITVVVLLAAGVAAFTVSVLVEMRINKPREEVASRLRHPRDLLDGAGERVQLLGRLAIYDAGVRQEILHALLGVSGHSREVFLGSCAASWIVVRRASRTRASGQRQCCSCR